MGEPNEKVAVADVAKMRRCYICGERRMTLVRRYRVASGVTNARGPYVYRYVRQCEDCNGPAFTEWRALAARSRRSDEIRCCHIPCGRAAQYVLLHPTHMEGCTEMCEVHVEEHAEDHEVVPMHLYTAAPSGSTGEGNAS